MTILTRRMIDIRFSAKRSSHPCYKVNCASDKSYVQILTLFYWYLSSTCDFILTLCFVLFVTHPAPISYFTPVVNASNGINMGLISFRASASIPIYIKICCSWLAVTYSMHQYIIKKTCILVSHVSLFQCNRKQKISGLNIRVLATHLNSYSCILCMAIKLFSLLFYC